MHIDKAYLCHMASDLGVELSASAVDAFDRYAGLLLEWNELFNLTAITDPREIVCKHFVDSLTVLPMLPDGPVRLIDVGTGAGFPGIPLAIVHPDLRLTLMDSQKKRLQFLAAVCEELDIHATLVHERAEAAGRNTQYREGYDIVTARAVAALPSLCEYCLPLVQPGGQFIAMKGPDGEEEVHAAAQAIEVLGGSLAGIRHITMDDGAEGKMERRLIRIIKERPTPPAYPRHFAKIKSKPL